MFAHAAIVRNVCACSDCAQCLRMQRLCAMFAHAAIVRNVCACSDCAQCLRMQRLCAISLIEQKFFDCAELLRP